MSDKSKTVENVVPFPAPAASESETATKDSTPAATVHATQSVPSAISSVMVRYYGLSGIVLLLTLLCIWLDRDARYAVCMLFSIGLFMLGKYTKHQWASGKIEERAMRFIQIVQQKTKCKIIFEDANGMHHEFYVGKKQQNDFVFQGVYLLYSYVRSPRQLIAWQLL